MNTGSNHNQTNVLKAIGRSCSIDFPNPLEWAQWCRGMANAALIDDVDRIEELWLSHQAKPEPTTKKEING